MEPDIRTILQTHSLFSKLSEKQLARVCKHAHHISLEEGQNLFYQRDPAQYFYYLCTGSIKLSRLAPDGNEKVIEFINPGNIFAEALMFLEAPAYPVNAAALSQSELIAIDSRDFTSMLRESVDTCFLLMGDMSQRLHGLIAEIDNISLQSGTCRVANYLLELAPKDRNEFKLDIQKGIMASRLSVKPETFSRILRNLQDRNILTVKGTHVTLHDREALQDFAAGLT